MTTGVQADCRIDRQKPLLKVGFQQPDGPLGTSFLALAAGPWKAPSRFRQVGTSVQTMLEPDVESPEPGPHPISTAPRTHHQFHSSVFVPHVMCL